MKKQKNYLFEIILLPILFVVIIATGITLYNIKTTKTYIERYIHDKRVEYIQEEKRDVYRKVQFVNGSIKLRQERLYKKLQATLKEKMLTAKKIATQIEKNYPNFTLEQKRVLLVNRLSALRFNQDRGYYFVLDENDVLLGHAIPKFVGKKMTNFIDAKGNFVVSAYRKALEEKPIAFVKHYFYRPQNVNEQVLKLSAVMKYNGLIIGTGEFLEDALQELKNDILYRLSNSKELKHYIFVMELININGGKGYAKMLVNSNRKDLVGQYLDDDLKDVNGFEHRKAYLEGLRENQETYVSYYYKKPNSNEQKEKLTYFYHNKEFNWIIGSGFYFEDLDQDITKIRKETEEYLNDVINNSIVWTLLFVLMVLIISSFVFFKIRKRINDTTTKLLNTTDSLNRAQKIAKIGSWELDMVHNRLSWSDEIFRMFEIDKNAFDASYEGFLNAIHPNDRDEVQETFDSAVKNRTKYGITHRLLVQDGRVKWVKEQGEVFYEKEIPILAVGVVQDITEQYLKDEKLKEQSELLAQQSKMAAMGEMIGNIAHQWRQPLSVITTLSSRLKINQELQILDEKEVNNISDNITVQAEYLSKTIEDFRNFFKHDKESAYVNTKELMIKMFQLLNAKLKDREITIIQDIEEVDIHILENEFIQALMNIVANSIDVLEKRGFPKIIEIKVYLKDAELFIVVQDNGGGIDEEIMLRIFEPYFTTKHQSQGTGIGLYMTHEIITKNLNGNIEVENCNVSFKDEKYTGARFIIRIPMN